MKFPQLPIGAHFRWREADYEKTGPVTARALADDSTRMIPRSAIVSASENEQAAPDTTDATRTLNPEKVKAALSACITEIQTACQQLPEPDRVTVAAALDRAYARLLTDLALHGAGADDLGHR